MKEHADDPNNYDCLTFILIVNGFSKFSTFTSTASIKPLIYSFVENRVISTQLFDATSTVCEQFSSNNTSTN
jgi:hypothetical protein